MNSDTPSIDVLVTGATGLIGRWLVPELTRQGRRVAVLIRGAERRAAGYRRWVVEHGGAPDLLACFEAELTRPGLGLSDADRAALASIEDVYHLAAAMRFGMPRAEARAANVAPAAAIAELAARSDRLRRFVHVSGFKIADDSAFHRRGIDPDAPYDAAAFDPLYQLLGGYEASKWEADVLIRDRARADGFALTRIHPGAIIGDSRTGETTQQIGFGALLENLWAARLAAIPGGERHWLPLIAVDFLARFLAAVPTLPADEARSFALVDDRTPPLGELVERLARHIGVAPPRRRIPMPIARAAARLGLFRDAGLEREGLDFIIDEAIDTGPTLRAAARLGLEMPDIDDATRAAADYLVASRFLSRPEGGPGRHRRVAGTPAFVSGDERQPDAVFLAGIPLGADSWDPVREHIALADLAADLPGLGRSAAAPLAPRAWTESLLAPVTTRPILVGHSLGTAFALEYAGAHPDRVAGLVLVSPFFLQAPPPWLLRSAGRGRQALRGMRRRHLEAMLPEGIADRDALVAGAEAALRRPGGRAAIAEALAYAWRRRRHLAALLAEIAIPVAIVAGENDPLRQAAPAGVAVTVLPGGHNVHLERPAEVAAVIAAMAAATSTEPARVYALSR
jgi:pimeloyl-ACP methyl ester carboxylesterase/nucleoside-diphosphate-sugar epimerase